MTRTCFPVVSNSTQCTSEICLLNIDFVSFFIYLFFFILFVFIYFLMRGFIHIKLQTDFMGAFIDTFTSRNLTSINIKSISDQNLYNYRTINVLKWHMCTHIYTYRKVI